MINGKMDAFEKWQRDEKWLEVRNLIVEKSKHGYSQKQISECLGMNEATFSRLKNKHPEIQQALDEADSFVLDMAFTALYKVAFGGTYTNEDVVIEDKQDGSKPKKKIHRIKREAEPNFNALVYILTQRFGRSFSDRKEELDIAREKLNALKGEWTNAMEGIDKDD